MSSGPKILMPNGNGLLGGANGLTAIYNPMTNSWSEGPTMPSVVINGEPTQLTMGNSRHRHAQWRLAPALSPAVDFPTYPGPTYIYDFNPATNVYTNLTAQVNATGFDLTDNSFVDNMLVLPTGQMWLTNFGEDPILSSSFAPGNPAWQPTITRFVSNGAGGFTLTGTQLNGLDKGAEYGDDNQMAENYPIVQVTDTKTGDVYYATTSNWSSVGVATGNASETVTVVLPQAFGNDPYHLVVIADGIASNSISGGGLASTSAGNTVVLGSGDGLTDCGHSDGGR